MSKTFEGYIQRISDQTGVPYDSVVDIYEKLVEAQSEVRINFSDCAGYTNAELCDPEILNKIVEKKKFTEEEKHKIIFRAARGSTKSTQTLIYILKLCGFSDKEIEDLLNEDASNLEQ